MARPALLAVMPVSVLGRRLALLAAVPVSVLGRLLALLVVLRFRAEPYTVQPMFITRTRQGKRGAAARKYSARPRLREGTLRT